MTHSVDPDVTVLIRICTICNGVWFAEKVKILQTFKKIIGHLKQINDVCCLILISILHLAETLNKRRFPYLTSIQVSTNVN